MMLTLLVLLLLATAQAPVHDAQNSDSDIAYGAALYASRCVGCHGTGGDAIGGVNLRSGVFRNAVVDRDLERFIRTGSPAGMPAFNLDSAEMAGIIAYVRNMNAFDSARVKLGNAARGRAVMEGKGACMTCHRVGATGSHVAPDLSEVGSARSAGSLYRSLTEPSAQMMPINRPVRMVMKDGKTITGRRLNEDTFTVQIIDEHERLVSVDRTAVKTMTVETKSPMPSYADKLTADEMSDLIAYLLTLKGV